MNPWLISRLALIVMSMLAFASFSRASELVLRHIWRKGPGGHRVDYPFTLMELALAHTADEGPFKLVQAKSPMSQARAINSLKKNEDIDFLFTMTSQEREEELLPVRIPLTRGLIGFRAFLIRKEDQPKFSAVKTLDDLKALQAGQVRDWPDTAILQSNGLNVVVGDNYGTQFAMLLKKRFDFFPRGINEIVREAEEHADKGITVEKSLILQYPADSYFFVNKSNTALAARIERGLRAAIRDGSFGKAFLAEHGAAIERMKLKERRIFKLNNPHLPKLTPLADSSLWFDPLTER